MAISKHLKFVGESYVKHLLFNIKLSVQLILLSLVAIIHGLLPWFLIDLISNSLNKITSKLNNRGKMVDEL